MAKSSGKKKSAKTSRSRKPAQKTRARTKRVSFRVRPFRWIGSVLLRASTIVVLVTLALVLVFSIINPPTTHTIWSEGRRLGQVDQEWVPLEAVAPVMARSVVAAEMLISVSIGVLMSRQSGLLWKMDRGGVDRRSVSKSSKTSFFGKADPGSARRWRRPLPPPLRRSGQSAGSLKFI